MALPYSNPSANTATNPYFQDNNFAKGVEMRNNNVATWGNFDYLLTAITATLWTPGMYMQFAGTSAPSGWLACDASAVSRTTYAALFAVIGTTYGVGNGTTTFNLPDARGLVMVGAGAHGTMTRANGTAFNGGTLGASRNDQMQGHWHEAWGSASYTGSGVFEINSRPSPVTTLADASTVQDPTTDSTNGTPRTGDETRPAEIAVLVCIKY